MTEDNKGFGEKPKQPDLKFKNAGSQKNQEYPSLVQQAKNFAQTAADVARNPQWVDEEEFERRMTLCRACPLYDEKQNRCKKCGCKLKGKARFKAGRCPIQKW